MNYEILPNIFWDTELDLFSQSYEAQAIIFDAMANQYLGEIVSQKACLGENIRPLTNRYSLGNYYLIENLTYNSPHDCPDFMGLKTVSYHLISQQNA